MKWASTRTQKKEPDNRSDKGIRRRKDLITGLIKEKDLITGLATAVFPLEVVAARSCYLLQFAF